MSTIIALVLVVAVAVLLAAAGTTAARKRGTNALRDTYGGE